jgi:membrane associated rhomboid family serine protease
VFRLPPLTPLVRSLLLVLLGLFVACAVLENFLSMSVIELFALEPRVLSFLTPLQVLTYVWIMPPVPGAVFSLLLSLLFLWLIVAPFEERYGKRRVVELIAVAAVCAALPALLVGQLAPRYAGLLAGPQIITLAAMCAYAVLLPPYAEVSFFGLLPLKPKHLLGIVVGFSVLGFLTTANAASLAADLGAIGGGVAFVKWWMQRPPPRGSRKKPGRLRVVGKNDDDSGSKQWLN